MTTITEKQEGSLHLLNDGFFGGRMDRKGDGYVALEFCPYDPDNQDWHIMVTDTVNLKDGHYGPVDVTREQLIELRDWINKELDKNS